MRICLQLDQPHSVGAEAGVGRPGCPRVWLLGAALALAWAIIGCAAWRGGDPLTTPEGQTPTQQPPTEQAHEGQTPGTAFPDLTDVETLVLMGDSWARQLGPALEPAVRDRGFTGRFIIAGVGGSTLPHWLSDADGRWTRTLEALATQPPAANGDVMWLIFLGGNDLVDGYPTAGAAIFADIEAQWRVLLQQIAAAAPAGVVVIGSYDYFPELCRPQLSRLNLTTAEAANQVLLGLDGVYLSLSDDYANVHYLPLWGTLPGLDPAAATRAQQWSDNAYYADCIHPNAMGFVMVAEAVAEALAARP